MNRRPLDAFERREFGGRTLGWDMHHHFYMGGCRYVACRAVRSSLARSTWHIEYLVRLNIEHYSQLFVDHHRNNV